ncbi:MAG: PepSY domain-containing protein [Desulfobacca sp.]|uniref:PepSY domain-containing protein n=1 Tax=Desulfobacca sp. TaxID=2067990 RepID=UPI0040497595
MNVKRKFIGCGTVALALAALLAIGSGDSALASQEAQVPNYSCSIKVPKPEPANLAAMAKITPDQAIAAAQPARPGVQVKKVELENENGCLVYDVEFVTGWEVKVDAGNGKVLDQQQEGPEKREK